VTTIVSVEESAGNDPPIATFSSHRVVTGRMAAITGPTNSMPAAPLCTASRSHVRPTRTSGPSPVRASTARRVGRTPSSIPATPSAFTPRTTAASTRSGPTVTEPYWPTGEETYIAALAMADDDGATSTDTDVITVAAAPADNRQLTPAGGLLQVATSCLSMAWTTRRDRSWRRPSRGRVTSRSTG
jgi:hypothetical protein